MRLHLRATVNKVAFKVNDMLDTDGQLLILLNVFQKPELFHHLVEW